MGHWHKDDTWKNKTTEKVINECNTTHCVAGWIQIFEKDKYNDMEAEECGTRCAPNLANFFHSNESTVESLVNTIIQD